MATLEAEVDGEVVSVELVTVDSATAINAIERAQIDVQIATAKQFPRDVRKFERELMALACTDKEVAESMFYALPRKERGIVKYIEGPSVRFAEMVQYSWGNVRAGARVIAIDETHVTAQGSCIDLEKNIGTSIEVKRRITNANGHRYSEDMIVVTGNAACSIALRNAIFDVIPFALAKRAYMAARKMATGGEQPIESRRSNALAWFFKVGAPEDRVLAALGLDKVEDIGEEQLVTLIGIKNAIQDGDTSVDQAFPRDKNGSTPEAQEVTDRLRTAGKSKPKKAEPDQARAAFESQAKAVSDWISKTKPEEGGCEQDVKDAASEWIAKAFEDDAATRSKCVEFVNKAGEVQVRQLTEKLKIAAKAREEFLQPSIV
jgi:hypothetical protein